MSLTDRQDWPVDQELASKYEVFESLGGGGMGRVLRARHRQLKRTVAIKLLQHDLKASDAVTRFLREARAAAQIRSPHVAQVMDTGVLANGQPYIVMEYLEGQDLAKMIALQGRLPVQQAVDYVLQALEAIAEAHSLQIIHRDIKPGNLFATQMAGGETFIKVVDFGLAKTSQALDTLDPGVTERGAVLGTPSYMAPEQFVDAQDVDARADVWGVGATLFALLTGIAPFRGNNLPQIYTAVMHRPIPTLRSVVPDLAEGIERIVAKCLSRDRAERYADVSELASELEAYAGASAREHVERIHRVIAGGRRLSEVDARALVPTVERGSVSSTFARESRGKGSDASRRTRRYSIALVVLAVALSSAAFWISDRSHKRDVAANNLQGQRPAAPLLAPVTKTESPMTSSASAVTVDTPAPFNAESVQPSAAASEETATPKPAVIQISPRPGSTKSMRPKDGPPRASKPSASSIYGQYP